MTAALLYVITHPDSSVSEEAYHDWYDSDHLPKRLGVQGVSSALRFKSLDAQKWVAYYDLDSTEVLKSQPYLVLKEKASDNERKLIPHVNMDRRVYKHLGTFGKQAAGPPKTLLAVEMTPYPSHEKEFNELYHKYLSHMSEIPGWTRSRRFELLEPLHEGICKYMTLHEFDTPNALGAGAHDRASSVKWKNEVIEIVTDRARSVWEPYHAADEPAGTHIINHNGIQFNVKIDGKEDGPVIALANPLGTNLSVWDKVVAELAPTYRIVRHDQRGHGRTSQSPKNTTFSELTDDLVAILDFLNIPKLHALIGVSMGGVVTLDFALRYPERVCKIICCDANPSSTPEGKSAWDARVTLVQEKGVGALADQTADRWFTDAWKGNPANQATFQAVREMVANTAPSGFIANARAMDDYSYFESAKGLKVPSLLVCGAQDPPLEPMRELEKSIPEGRLVLINDCGHLPMVEQPEEYIKVLRRFL
jgi:3-oxoadipate enol-lactonase